MAIWDDTDVLWDDPTVTWDEASQTTFNPRVDLQVDGIWTDITDYVYYRDSIRLSGGQQDETSQVQAGSCQLTLNNNDGRFSPRKPTSPYYGKIGRNTPLRLSLPVSDSYVWMDGPNDYTACVQAADTAGLSVTGDLDLRVEYQLENWRIDNYTTTQVRQRVVLASKLATASNQVSWHWSILRTGLGAGLVFGWSPDGTVGGGFNFSGSVPPPVPGNGRLALRVTLDVNNGLGGWTVTFYSSDSINGTWTQFDQYVYTGGTTSIFDSTAPVQLGNDTGLDYATYGFGPAYGKLLKFQMRNGIGGTLVANADMTIQTEGGSGFTDSVGVVWTLQGTAAIYQREFLFTGEVASWPSTWDTGGFDVYVPITANGIMRRLGQGARPLQSTLRRRIPSFTPLAYWPMEDGSDATQLANAVSGGAPMLFSGLTLSSDNTLPGSEALPVLGASSYISGNVLRPSGTITAWRVEEVYKIAAGSATQRTYLQFRTTGTGAIWSVLSGTGGSTLHITDADGADVVNQAIGTGTDIFGQWIDLDVTASVSGGTVTWRVDWSKLDGSAGGIGGSFSGTLGNVTRVSAPGSNFSSDLTGMALGHIAVFGSNPTAAYDGAFNGYSGEYAGQRMARLSHEELIQVSVFGTQTLEELVGPQGQQTFLSLNQDAGSSDGGILYERNTLTGLGYRDRETMTNQDAALTIPYTSEALNAPLQPTGDDFLVRNSVTVSRVGGSSATQTDTTSPLSVNAPPLGVGDYSVSVPLSLDSDDRLNDIAGWLLHRGTWDEERYPSVSLSLHNDVSLVPSVLVMTPGDRVVITDPPDWLAPEDIDLMFIGYRDTLDQFLWTRTLICIPYGPWHVAVTDATTYDRLDSDVSTLTSDITSGATTMSVTSTGSVWADTTGHAGEFNFDVFVGGERMTVTAVSGTTSPQTFTVTRSVNGVVKAQTAGTEIHVVDTAHLGL